MTFQKLNHPILNHVTTDSVPISSEGRRVTIAGDYFSEDFTYVCIVSNGADGDFVQEAKVARFASFFFFDFYPFIVFRGIIKSTMCVCFCKDFVILFEFNYLKPHFILRLLFFGYLEILVSR